MKEKPTQSRILLHCSVGSSRLFRNNVGAYRDGAGNWIKYGVYNPGGSDLIGWNRVEITADMVGLVLPVFTAIEVKGDRGSATSDQERFIKMVLDAGGCAGVARSPEEAKEIMSRYVPFVGK